MAPEDPDLHLEAGLALLERGQVSTAKRSFLQSLRLDPASGDSHEAIAHERVRNHPLFKRGFETASEFACCTWLSRPAAARLRKSAQADFALQSPRFEPPGVVACRTRIDIACATAISVP